MLVSHKKSKDFINNDNFSAIMDGFEMKKSLLGSPRRANVFRSMAQTSSIHEESEEMGFSPPIQRKRTESKYVYLEKRPLLLSEEKELDDY